MSTRSWTTATRLQGGRARILAVALAIVALVVTAPAPGAAGTREASRGRTRTLELEIVENGTKFTVDSAPAFPDGLPAFGAKFITVGYIYPAGTIQGTNGVLADGSPEFPDKMIGRWTCRGYFVADGAHTTTGPMLITNQLLDFGAKAGDETIVSDGYEYADVGVAVHRAIIGGTGTYERARGEQVQTLLVFPNAAGGVSLSVHLEVTK